MRPRPQDSLSPIGGRGVGVRAGVLRSGLPYSHPPHACGMGLSSLSPQSPMGGSHQGGHDRHILLAAIIGHSLGSISLGPSLTKALPGMGDIRRDRVGQYRRDESCRARGARRWRRRPWSATSAKGLVVVWIGAIWDPDAALAAAGAVVLGHTFPAWLGVPRRQGGRDGARRSLRACLAGRRSRDSGAVARDRGAVSALFVSWPRSSRPLR